jgi:hypothetical protein
LQKERKNLVCPITCYERHPPVVAIGVYNCEAQLLLDKWRNAILSSISQLELTVQQGDEFIINHRRPHFNTDRIADSSKVLDMCAVQLPSSVPNPKEMRRGVVVLIGCQCWCSDLARNRRVRYWISTSHGFLIGEQESFVAKRRKMSVY